jgi:hypothetical protein
MIKTAEAEGRPADFALQLSYDLELDTVQHYLGVSAAASRGSCLG